MESPGITRKSVAMLNKEKLSSTQPGTWNQKPGTLLVGRDEELVQLHRYWAKAFNGTRQIVFL